MNLPKENLPSRPRKNRKLVLILGGITILGHAGTDRLGLTQQLSRPNARQRRQIRSPAGRRK